MQLKRIYEIAKDKSHTQHMAQTKTRIVTAGNNRSESAGMCQSGEALCQRSLSKG